MADNVKVKEINDILRHLKAWIRKYARQCGFKKKDIKELNSLYLDNLSVDAALEYIEKKEQEPLPPDEILSDLVKNGFSKKILEEARKYLNSL